MRTRLGSRQRLLIVTAAVAASASACSVSLDQIPLPAPQVEGYSVTATFANALNLPTKSKVRLNGADVGQVESMQSKNYAAVVSMRIRSDVQLPAATTAELRSATPMGDVFVELTPPAHPDPAAPNLGDGAQIPMDSTSAAATIEEVLSRAALLVNGGAIENLTLLANRLGAAVGDRGDKLADMISQTRELVQNLAARSERIRQVLSTTGDLSATLASHSGDIQAAIAAAAPSLQVLGDNTQNIVDLIGQVNRITRQLDRFPSINGTNDHSLINSVDQLAEGLNNAATNPKANLDGLNSILPIVVKVTNASSAHVNVNVVRLAIGLVPDPNTPGDSAGRAPDATDWTNMVGSLTYTLNRLKDKVEPGR